MIVPVVPLPAHVAALSGTYKLPKTVSIAARSADELNVADFAANFFRTRGIASIIVSNKSNAAIRVSLITSDTSLGREGYLLRVDPNGIVITAAGGAGLYYGLQTLEQLFEAETTANTIDDVEIRDAPAFAWRGIMLDVSRHFYDVPTVERFIDLAAHYKLNTFHWHLTDDQGWRVEINRYPRLTTIGSCRAGTEVGRNPNDVEGPKYCGNYTQAQIRSVVAYAAKRYVTVVPEIDMPGHSAAAVAAYPFLGCTGQAIPVKTTWGGSYAICPTEQAVTFEENVLDEILQMFPAPYIHTGGDEVPFDMWKTSPFVSQLMQQQNLADYPQVQAYFERRIEQYVESKGRRMVGWDDVLSGDVSRNAVIMSWHAPQSGILAAQAGNDVVMASNPPLFLDAYQGSPNQEPLAMGAVSTIRMVYRYDPLAPVTTPEQREHIIGVQGEVWTELIDGANQLFYMALPRELALSEVAWVPQEDKDWNSFQTRLGPQYLWLQQQALNFRLPHPEFSLNGQVLAFDENAWPDTQTISTQTDSFPVTIALTDSVPNAMLLYTTDGTRPDARALRYVQPLQITLALGQQITITAAAMLPNGRISTYSRLLITRTAR